MFDLIRGVRYQFKVAVSDDLENSMQIFYRTVLLLFSLSQLEEVMPRIKFYLTAPTKADEAVYVVGNIPELGQWKHCKAAPLIHEVAADTWSVEISVSSPGEVLYRYFIASEVSSDGGDRMRLVREWEVHLEPRSVTVEDGKTTVVDDKFGVVADVSKTDKGWLCGQTEIRFHISDAGDKPVVSWRKPNSFANPNIAFEVEDEVPVATKLIKPFVCEYVGPAEPVPLPEGNETVLTYVAEVTDIDHFSGKFVLTDKNGVMLGSAGMLGSMLHNSIGFISLAVSGKDGKAIGSLYVEYVVIRTYDRSGLSMEKAFCMQWKRRPTLHIGHRGAGNSFTADTMSDLFENTISSFKKAALHGAAMIEFDVQLTKDKIPVVFHDFTICASVASKTRPPSLHEVEVQTLTYDDLQTYAVRHRSRKTDTREPKFKEHDDHPHFQPFPKFEEVFKEVPEHVGFDVELKWPHYYVTKEWDHGVNRFFDANEYVDRILDDVFKYAGKRRLLFSCFEANICTMLRRKQNKYPVFFLTNGDSKHYDEFMELRSRYNRLAIPFAASEGFLGLVTLEKDAYADSELVKKVHDAGLVLFLYGNDISEPKNRKLLIEQGADAVIYDRIHDALPEGKNEFLELPSTS